MHVEVAKEDLLCVEVLRKLASHSSWMVFTKVTDLFALRALRLPGSLLCMMCVHWAVVLESWLLVASCCCTAQPALGVS